MAQWLSILSAVLSVFCVIATGLLLRRVNWLTAEADESLLKLVIRVLLPALIVSVTLGNPALAHPQNVLVSPLVGFGTVLLGIAVALVAGRWAGLRSESERGTFAMSVGLYNYGFIPIPLALLLFDDRTLGVLFVHNLGVELALWTVGIVVLTGRIGRDWHRRVLNPPIITILVVLGLNWSGLGAWVPDFVLHAVDLLGQCSIPVALLLIGATAADHVRDARSNDGGTRVVAWACVLRLGFLPLLFLGLVVLLPVSLELKQVIVLEAAMPAALVPILLATHYGGDTPTAVRVALGTSVVSLITAPLWIRAGLAVLGQGGG